MKHISPSDSHLQFVGRIDFSNPEAPSFSHPGVSVRIRFTGSRLHVLLEDSAHRQSPETTNYFNVIVDNQKPIRMKTTPAEQTYVLAHNLSPGEHEVVLFKRSESSHGDDLNVGKVTIHGFRIDADADLLQVPKKRWRMEFIGDSITCGYGNEFSSPNPVNDHFTTLNSNAYMAWGAIAARKLDADYMSVAYSGRGVVRNYGGHDSPTIPDIYLQTLPDDPKAAPWQPANYIPHIVVINLGTNDFSEGLPPGPAIDDLQKRYGERYQSFVMELQGYYPQATFVIAFGPMLSDSFPPEYQALHRVRTELTRMVNELRSTGMEIHLLELTPQQPPFGEDFHPTVATHQRMAKKLVRFLSQHGIGPKKDPYKKQVPKKSRPSS
ncbi:MAG: hypothetical protein JXX29_09440 [Deltaproteobacteria bacterium]|nr:hypothetical protein [Deltaproteobacteria bacterium]MBN2671887.1 hypothetical protein [Deltaproteobacteria bacterium]